jgi:hypothetical protein
MAIGSGRMPPPACGADTFNLISFASLSSKHSGTRIVRSVMTAVAAAEAVEEVVASSQ